jgi:2-polyprenyl-3-methyl-5-hydroxy-6-metoxy-1,4-benzoquinol methylase
MVQDYQYKFTENLTAQKEMYDHSGRGKKADKTVAVLEDHFGNVSGLCLLDISCSTGIMSQVFARHFKEVVGIDIDEKAVAFAKDNFQKDNLAFHVMDGLNTEFPDKRFDIVVCNQMYEHVPDAWSLMKEVRRVLAPGGVCYFGATNRLNIVESHYGRLPFLSWLPKPLAHLYLRILGRAQYYYETHYTYWTLKKLVKDFDLIDYTVRVVEDPIRFHAEDIVRNGSRQQRLALAILKHAYWFFPGYIWLLKKPL